MDASPAPNANSLCPPQQLSQRPYRATHERISALESLWVAIKELNADGTGYTPKMAEAVARLRKLEAGE